VRALPLFPVTTVGSWPRPPKAAEALRQAVAKVLKEGKTMPPDLGGQAKTADMMKAVAAEI